MPSDKHKRDHEVLNEARDKAGLVNNVPFRPPHPYRLPEDFPWKGLCSATITPVLLLSWLPELDDIAALDDFLDKKPAPAALLEPALGLARIYRSLNMEPILLVCQGTSREKAPGKTAGQGKANAAAGPNEELELCQALLRAGTRAVLVEERDVWETIATLTTDPVFLHPVHFPHARKLTLLRLLEMGSEAAGHVPANGGKTGFPLRLCPEHVSELARGASLKELISQGKLHLFQTGDRDCDLPDAGHVRGEADSRTTLSPTEAVDLLHHLGVPMRGVAHAKAVGLVAMALAKRYLLKSRPVDWELALSSGLLHDVAKGIARHEAVGALWLDYLGLPRMANCVRDHRDLVLKNDQNVTERELVYLADKYCYGPRYVPLEERFGQKMELNGGNEKAMAGIKRRLSHARALEKRVERELGVSPSVIARMTLEDSTLPAMAGNCPSGESRS